jgi:hypothetical protein
MTARHPLDKEGLDMDVTEMVALAVALSLPLWLAVEEVLQAARVETRRTARKPEGVAPQRVAG